MNYIVFLTLPCLFACSALNQKLGLKDDNPVEEVAEGLIESKTGLDVDLTPATPEK